ncbi:Caskin-1 [Myotis davidii]|uniref:Caskin-1 n=1 Tax=Myotis davidii TaxID=225400 RepID=L5LVN5_MYODS|nr:Caskin-1 [Myotis davidii]
MNVFQTKHLDSFGSEPAREPASTLCLLLSCGSGLGPGLTAGGAGQSLQLTCVSFPLPELLGSTKKINVNFQDPDGFSALHHAALNGNTELITLLLEAQAAVDIKDNKGKACMRPLHYAAWQGRKEPMKLVLKAGSAVNIPSDEGHIPLHLAAQHGHYDVSEMLLQHQSNPCMVDSAGKTPLDLACEFGRVGVVQLLLSSNMCTALLEPRPGDTTDPNGTSPLHLAAKNGHIDIIRLLLQAGIDINRQTKAGTALHEAALCGKTEVVRLLLDNGINAHVRNTYSQTALDIVHQFTTSQASKEIKQLLREASAALQVRATQDYCNNYDLTSLNVKAGDIITVLEQHPDGRWKGCIHDNRTGNDRVGYFPSSLGEAIVKRAGKSYPGGDRSGSLSSVAVGRSSGAHSLHAGSEGVKLLATVLSQKSISESSPGDSPVKPLEGSAGAARSQPPVAHAGQVYAELPSKKLEPASEGKLQLYAPNFLSAGYDLPTISRMTPEDLTAIGVTKPGHRKKITAEISSLSIPDWLPEHKPANLAVWLSMIGLAQYYKVLVDNGYENIDFITDITWEDLQEIGITKLGHQKKLMLAVRKLAELQKAEYAKYEGGPLRQKAPQSLEVMAIESPPPPEPAPAECQSPKMTTFQDSELSGELQAAMTGPAEGAATPAAAEKPSNHLPPTSRASVRQEPSLGGRARHMSSSQELLAPATAKVKPTPQLLPPMERPMSPRSLPQSPTHRGLRPKKRAHSLNRYTASDSEQERDELLVPAAAGPYATVQRRVGRSHSVRAPAGADKNVNRSQSFAVRPRKKGPPPPPPKRSSSAMVSANLADESAPDAETKGAGTEDGQLGVRAQRRRASDLAGSVDTGSAGSVKSIAAMLELSSIGGGGRAARRPPEGHPTPRPDSPEPGRVATVLASVKHKEAIGPDGEVVNRRRTLSGPVTGLLATARRGPGEPAGPADHGHLVEDGTVRQRPRGPAKGEAGGEGPPLARVEASATLKRRIRAKQSQQENVKFILTESDTVKRRPKAKEREAGPEPPPSLSVYQNGTGTVRRRRGSEHAGPLELPPPPAPTEPLPSDLMHLPPLPPPDSDARKPVKPPVSPKPVLAQPVPKIQGSPTPASKKVPLPGPSSPGSAQQKLEETSACLAAALQAVEEKIRQEDAQGQRPSASEKSTGSILDDIGSMFDDLADQLDAMLE